MTERRAFVRRSDLAVIAVLIVAAAVAIWFMRTRAATEGNVAVVTVRGQEIMRLDLSDYAKGTHRISLLEDYFVPVSLELADGGIRFVEVDCPDHLCEQMGICKNEYETAICLPNATVVAVYAPDNLPALPAGS